MYEMVIRRGTHFFAAVSHSKRKLRQWAVEIDAQFTHISAYDCAWRTKDKTGWTDGSTDAWKEIPLFPDTAVVLW